MAVGMLIVVTMLSFAVFGFIVAFKIRRLNFYRKNNFFVEHDFIITLLIYSLFILFGIVFLAVNISICN